MLFEYLSTLVPQPIETAIDTQRYTNLFQACDFIISPLSSSSIRLWNNSPSDSRSAETDFGK